MMATLLLGGCYSYRYVPEGEHVLEDNKVYVEMADGSEVSSEVKEALSDVQSYFLQKPNSHLLGIRFLPSRVGMAIYGIAHPKDSTFVGRYFRRLGQAPRIYDADKARRTAQQIERLMVSRGSFGTRVSYDTVKVSKHNITIGYHVNATRRYLIDEVNYRCSDDGVRLLLLQWTENSLLQVGSPYDQEHLAAERSRLVTALRESGYYRASPDRISFLVDTTYSSTHLSIDVNVDATDLRVYHINNIYVYPTASAAFAQGNAERYDTLIYTYPTPRRDVDFLFVHSGPMAIHPRTISRSLMLFPGMTYRPRYITNTYNSMLALRNFKYINIDFVESASSTDSLPLVDARVHLISATQQRLSLSLELTNASPLGDDDTAGFFLGGNLGIETALEYRHKNLFGGAEQLRVKGALLFELSKHAFGGGSDEFRNGFSALEASVDASLDMPILLLPFTRQLAWQRIKPHTLFGAGGSYQYRYYFERILANTSFGYTWSHSQRASNQLLPIELTFVRMLSLDDAFAARLRTVSDLRMKYQYSSHFIMGARYDYTYSNQTYGSRTDFSSIHLSVESAGNLLGATAPMLGATADTNGVMRLLGVPFSQYLRFGAEYTRYHYFASRSSLVARLLLGVGLPYGNSVAMPYEKSFFGGGTTTMRAWQLRRLGPGSYQSEGDMLERVGDLQLVLNLEGRFPIAGIFEWAAFADMGNVWLTRASSQYAGGELKWSSIPGEVAVGVGLGLRLNVSVATIRIDFGIPLYDPGYDASLRWRLPHWNVNQVVTNFGINYPF